MECLLRSRFTPNPTCTSPPLRLRFLAPPRRRPIRLNASPGGSGTSGNREDGEVGEIEDDLSTLPGKVIDAYRNSNNDLRTFLQNLVEAGVADESTVFGGEKDEFLRALIDADLPGRSPDLSVLWKFPAVALASFVGVPALLGYLGEAAGAHVPAWMPLVYSLASFLVGTLLVADSSISDEEWEEWVRRR
ncbi:hypothetical protein E2562_002593 [Oryza meyeriana var. granulata]|uniref:Uncharacterized protein n=1 Tax=Oryza meyeriana var. granulata TaxID=110450 RepID=A0A6G1F330_9ORYZ|nr:hypothetical protein E2562_002593 [Oryza meyeriana var. granulata]